MKLKKHANGWYYAHFSSRSGPQRLNLKTRNADEARLLAKEARIEELEQADRIRALTAETVVRITTGGRVTCRDALDLWLGWTAVSRLAPASVERYRTYISAFFERGGWWSRQVSAVTATDVSGFVNPADEDIKASTRHNRLSALQSLFAFLVVRGVCVADPAAEVAVRYDGLTFEQKEKEHFQPFNPVELDLLQKIDHPFWSLAMQLGRHCGLRISDAAKLEWSSFAKPGRLIVWTDKHDRRVELDLPKPVEDALAKVSRSHIRFVFPKQAAIVSDPATRSTLSTEFSRLLRRHGITGKSFHSFRHTFATAHRDLGESIDQIRLKLGHALPSTTEIYVHSS